MMATQETKRKVTVRPELSDDVNSRLSAIATRNGMSRERAVALLLEAGVMLTEAGDEKINSILQREGARYRANLSNIRSKAANPQKGRGRVIGAATKGS